MLEGASPRGEVAGRRGPRLLALRARLPPLVLELPLLLRMLRTQRTHGTEPAASSFDLAVSSSLAWDYAGSLFASILFPLVFVPALGLVRTSLLTGAVNAALALSVSWIMRRDTRPRGLALPCGAVCVALAALAVTADALHLVPSE